LSQDAAAGRLSQVINRWIYTACLVFGLDLADQQRTFFTYAYSVYQVEYSRNLLFASGRQMEDVFDAAVDRTRSRLDVPQVSTLFGAKMRPRTARGRRPPRLEVAIETPAYDLTKFKVYFGNLTLKGYNKGERVLRFQGIAHNTKDLRCVRTLDKFAPIVTRLKKVAEEFCTALDYVDVGFIPDGLLDVLPAASQLGGTRVGGIDVNKPRSRAVLAAALALAIAPGRLHRRLLHRHRVALHRHRVRDSRVRRYHGPASRPTPASYLPDMVHRRSKALFMQTIMPRPSPREKPEARLEDVDRAGDHERGQGERRCRFDHHEGLGPWLDR
jgi:hypothetical protein